MGKPQVELAIAHVLSALLFWDCPNGKGAIFESEDIREFPDHLQCDRCGQVHWFDEHDVTLGFIATDQLTRLVGAGG